jgi:peptidoglycan hydrolase CwlO-like protein
MVALRNLTLDELKKEAELQDNKLALQLAEKFEEVLQGEKELQESIDVFDSLVCELKRDLEDKNLKITELEERISELKKELKEAANG